MVERVYTPMISRRKLSLAAALAVIFILALWLRMSSADWGLPFRLHPDEWKYVSAGAHCHQGEWNPKYFRNPPGFSYLNALWYPFWMPIRTPVEVPEWLRIAPQWMKPNHHIETTFLYRPFDLVLGGRVLSALMGALTCIAVFFLARNWLPPGFALGAAALMAVSFANVRESHFAVNDAAAACLVTWTMAVGMFACKKQNPRWFYAAAVLGGVSVAFKYNMFPSIAALMGLQRLQYYQNPGAEKFGQHVRDILLIGVISVVCFLLICPFPITDTQTFMTEIGKLRDAAAKPWQGQDTRWAGFQLAETIWISEGITASLLAIAGLIIVIQKKYWDFLFFPLVYALLVCTHSLYFVRFSLPLLPWIAIGAAIAIHSITSRMKIKPAFMYAFTVFLFLICAIEPLIKDIRSNHLLKQTDTRIQFLQWLRTENTDQVLVALDQFSIPLVYRGVADFWTVPPDPRIVYIDRLPSNELAKLNSLNAPVGLMGVSDFAPLPGHIPDSYQERRNAIMEFAGSKEPVKVFQPFAGEWTPKALDAEDTYSPFCNLWNRERPGAVIEVFSIKKED